jgi:hypothetical protein
MIIRPLVSALLTNAYERDRGEQVDEFLLRRTDEDEHRARVNYLTNLSQLERDQAIAAYEARRKIVALYRGCTRTTDGDAYLNAVKIIAEIYSSHPDYREEWRPSGATSAHPSTDAPANQQEKA